MLLSIAWSEGVRSDAVVLALGPGCIRVTMEGNEDALDLRRNGDSWMDEQGREISFNFIGALGDDSARICAELFPISHSAAL